MSVQDVTDNDFTSFVQDETERAVIIDFWAVWCGPCKMLSPIVVELAEEYPDKLKVGKLNVDENPRTAGEYGIMSIPTLLVFKGGEVVRQIIGYMPKNQLKAKLGDLI